MTNLDDDILPVPPVPAPLPPELVGKYRVAMIIDGVVHAVMLLQTDDAARYLSNPTFVQVPKRLHVTAGHLYDGKTFTDPNL